MTGLFFEWTESVDLRNALCWNGNLISELSGIVVHVTTFNPAPAGTMFPVGKVVFRSTFLPGDLR